MKIGFFDSGLGGLSILQSVARVMPEYDYVYYGDTDNLPYGEKSEAEIYAFSMKAMRYLFDQGALLTVIACNTASAETLRRLQDGFLPKEYPDRKILGVIIPAVEEVRDAEIKSALLIATKRTIDSRKYDRELQKLRAGIKLESIATPELVPFIEANRFDQAYDRIDQIVREHVVGKHEGLILGCTHYAILKERIRAKYPDLQIFSQDEIIPKKLLWYLEKHPEIASKLQSNRIRAIHLTAKRNDYAKDIESLLSHIKH